MQANRLLKSFVYVTLAGLCSMSIALASTNLDSVLMPNPAYVTDIARQTNSVSVTAANTIRESLRGDPLTIPAGWRLVNVIPKNNDYVLFFQSANGSVHSLRMQGDGSVSGHDIIMIPAD